MDKAKGGRGQRAENKYERFTVTLSPDLKEYLDSVAEGLGVSRSEAVARVLDEYKTSHTSRPVLLLEASRGEERDAATVTRAATETALEDMEEAPSLEGFTAFKVVSTEISDKFRRRRRWSKEAYSDLQRQLEQGDTIRLVRGTWKTALGETVAVKRLARAYQHGNLEPLS